MVKKIPAGKVLTYKQIAVKLGCAGLARAVGNALNKNKNREIPCHRVVRSDGEVGGYNKGSFQKLKLLDKEGVKISKNKIRGGGLVMNRDEKVKLLLEIQDRHLTPIKRKMAYLVDRAIETRYIIESGGEDEKAFSDWLKETKKFLEEVPQMVRQTVAIFGEIS